MKPARAIRCALVTVALLAIGLASAPGAALAQVQQAPLPQALTPTSPDKPPPGFRITPREAITTAEGLPQVRAARAKNPRLQRSVELPLYFVKHHKRLEVRYSDGHHDQVDAHIDGVTGKVLEVWTGPQAYTILARGYSPSIGRSVNRWYIWLPLALLFVAPFVDPRRPFRLLHLDLLVLLGFGISEYFFNKGQIDASVPLVYPLLVYLLVRTALAGFRPQRRDSRLMPHARTSWLVAGLVALMIFRVGLNLVDSAVMDVGYSSVVGADRISHKQDLYVDNDVHGDTYGPVNYLAYVPFELLFPLRGTWDNVPAAHAAALTFDLLAVVGLMLLGTRLRAGPEGRRLGLAMAFAWSAYPFTLLGLNANVNDGLVAVLLIFALLALRSPARRGLMLGLAAAAKFAPVVLAPLLASGTGEERRVRSWPAFAAAFSGIVVLSVALYLPDGGLREFWNCTVGFQLGRDSVFSIWGLHPSLGWLQDVVKLAGLAFAVTLAFVPRRRDLRQISALFAAALIASQLSVDHWFYFYIPWFTPFVLLSTFGAYSADGPDVERGSAAGFGRRAASLKAG